VKWSVGSFPEQRLVIEPRGKRERVKGEREKGKEKMGKEAGGGRRK